MSLRNILLVLLVVTVWGINFLFVHIALEALPPLFLSAVRFGLCAIPGVFFLPRPRAPLKDIFGFGLFTFAMQFGFLFSGMHFGLSPGLASLVIQIQVFFSLGLSIVVFGERPGLWKFFGALISFVGIALVAVHSDASATFLGFVCVLASAFFWATGNVFSKKVNARSPLALIAWGNLLAFPVMIAASLFIEGPAAITAALSQVSWATIGSILYIVLVSTYVGYGIWGYLLNSHPMAIVAPFTLLVPVVGLLSSAYFFGEALPVWKIGASFFVIAGITFNIFEKQIKTAFRFVLFT